MHSSQLDEFDKWYNHATKVIDFWLLAYYPYKKYTFGTGLKSEAQLEDEDIKKDWLKINKAIDRVNHDNPNFPMFLGFEWQGSGEDGDHNVFFKGHGDIKMPLRYEQLVEAYKGEDVVGIPHHLAYSKGHRGKNWDTHNADFSPFAEIKSQHGSSESAVTDMKMDRHIHMGPRTGGTSVFDGLNKGNKVGIIASGDNHVLPADQINGIAGVWAESNTKEAIWDAMLNKRVYGMSDHKISLWFDVDGKAMGSTLPITKEDSKANFEVIGNSKIKLVELIHNGELVDVQIQKGHRDPNNEVIRFKTKIEFGWGPNPLVYEDITSRVWNIDIKSDADIIEMEPAFSNFQSEIKSFDKNHVVFDLNTYKTSHSGKWMGETPVTPEGYIFEFEGKLDDVLTININGRDYERTVRDILDNTDLIVELEDSVKLAKDRFKVSDYYRSDSFYHNAYKTRINKGFSVEEYSFNASFDIKSEDKNGWYSIKVYQEDGQVAWSSPIWFE